MGNGYIRNGIGSSGNGLPTRPAIPNANRMALDSSLAAESANVFRMLGNLHLLHLLAQGGTISVKEQDQVLEAWYTLWLVFVGKF